MPRHRLDSRAGQGDDFVPVSLRAAARRSGSPRPVSRRIGLTTRRLASLLAGVLLIAQATVLIAPVVVLAAPVASTAWSANGPVGATAAVSHDGTGGVAELDYAFGVGTTGGGVPLKTWTLHAVASASGTQAMRYSLTGLHAWFNVTVGLRAYVIHSGIPSYIPLVN